MSFIPHFLDFVRFANHIFTFLLPPPPILPPTSLVVDHMYAQIYTLFIYATDLMELHSNCTNGNNLAMSQEERSVECSVTSKSIWDE